MQISKLALFVLALSVPLGFFLAQQPSKLALFVLALSILLSFFSPRKLKVGFICSGSFHSFWSIFVPSAQMSTMWCGIHVDMQMREKSILIDLSPLRKVHLSSCLCFIQIADHLLCLYLDTILSSTEKMDHDVLGPITAFSNQSLKEPPIYPVPNDILHILFRLICMGPPLPETLKHAPSPSLLRTSRHTLACCIEALLVDCGGATQLCYPCQLPLAVGSPAIHLPPCWQGLCGYVLEHWVGGCSGI